MTEPDIRPPSPASSEVGRASLPLLLVGAGFVYLALGVVIAGVVAVGGMTSALFPAGWLFPALLIVSGVLMIGRRRFDVAATLWAGFTLAVFVLGALIYMNALDHGLDDAAAFDATLIAAAFGLVVLLLRPGFRD